MKSDKIIVLPNNYPLFGIPDSVERIYTELRVMYSELSTGEVLIIDNKNFEGNLARRRLRVNKKRRLTLHNSILSLPQLLHSKYRKFIDSNGILYTYTKDTKVSLETFKIHNATRVENLGYLLTNVKLPIPIEVSAIIYKHQKYMQLLHVNGGYLLYNLLDEDRKPTWRMI